MCVLCCVQYIAEAMSIPYMDGDTGVEAEQWELYGFNPQKQVKISEGYFFYIPALCRATEDRAEHE
jgi:hypothetical protein